MTCHRANSNFSNFFFSHWLLHKCFFSFLIKAFANFQKLIIVHRKASIAYKNRENLKMLIEIFLPKRIVSNVILTFLDHLKPKIFFVDQTWWSAKNATLFKFSGSTPVDCIFYLNVLCFLSSWVLVLNMQFL